MARIAGTSDGRAAAMRKSFMRLHFSAKGYGQAPWRWHTPQMVQCNNSIGVRQSPIVNCRIRAPETPGSCVGPPRLANLAEHFFADLQQFGCTECNNRNISLLPVSSLLYCRGASRKANGRDPRQKGSFRHSPCSETIRRSKRFRLPFVSGIAGFGQCYCNCLNFPVGVPC